jgi:hypothetical protein
MVYLYEKLGINWDKMLKIVSFTLFFTLSVSCVFSQVDGSGARAKATVIEPIVDTKYVDLNFASMSIVVAGSVELISRDVLNSSPNITLPVTAMGTFTALSYVVSGTTAYTYKITVPKTPMEVTIGNKTMVARSLDTDPMLYAGDELLAGVFVSFSPMNVTVNYN